MDIVITSPAGPFRSSRMHFCMMGLKHIVHDKVHVRPARLGQYDELIAAALDDEVSERFIWMPDCCMVTSPFTPARYVNSGMLQRRPEESDLMVTTIRHLLKVQAGADLYDYELDLPTVFEKKKVLEMNKGLNRTDMLPRTLYGNLYPEAFLRMDNPRIEKWTHGDDPNLAVVSLSDEAIEHRDCITWLKKRLS